MDLRQLQYFAAAVEQRSMSAAARVCRVTQPTLSAQMRRLETELNDVLFGRTSIGLRPTKSAQRLYQRLSPLLDDAFHGTRYIRSGRADPIQSVRVGIPYSAASLMMRVVRQAACKLGAANPHIKVTCLSSEMGPASDTAGSIRVRYNLHGASLNSAISDQWLLVSVERREGGRAPRVDCLEGHVDVPALPSDIREALKCSGGQALFHFRDEDPVELISVRLAQNHGQVLVPRLAVNPEILRHPRLCAREVTTALPTPCVVVECADPDDAAQRACRIAIEERMARPKPGAAAALPAQPLPDTRQLRYFLRAFDEGCITRAATKLNVVQPAVSMQIRTLERSLGGKLFDRSRQGIHPTPLGRKVRAVYAPILEALQVDGRSASARGSRARSLLRVGVLPGLDEDSLLVQATTATIVQWRKTFTNVELKIVESHSGVLLDWLADNVIDMAIVEDMHAHTSLNETVLCSEPLSILTAARPSICPPGPIKMADIAKLDLVLPSARHGLRALLERKFADAGLPLVPKLELDSMAAAIRLVKSGGWATVMPSSAVRRSLDNHILEAHPIIRPAIMRELRSVQLPRHPKRPWEKEFIGFLRARLSQVAA